MNSSRLAVPVLPLDSDFRQSLSIAREFGAGGIEIDGRHGIDLVTLSDTGFVRSESGSMMQVCT